jgi:hypothetical protein
MLSTNGTSTIQDANSQAFVNYYVDNLIEEQEKFLKIHSDNLKKNTRVYNSFFDTLVYKNVCEALYSNTTQDSTTAQDCSDFMGGILQKGLHSSNVAFWDGIRELLNDFKKNAARQLDDPVLIELKLLLCKYLEPSYWNLNDNIESSINIAFSNENKLLLGIFVCFIGIVILLFMVVWRAFIFSTRKSLFMTKTMIAIIPPEVIYQNRKIREYVIKSSKQVVYQVK